MSGNASKLEKLKIVAYSDAAFKTKIENDAVYSVMFNPSSIKQKFTIEYNEDQPTNAIKPQNIFNKITSENLTFDLIFDGTGAASEKLDVREQLDKLTKVVYKFYGVNHETPYVSLFWGSWCFDGRLNSMNIDYTMFKPDGDPLRAKVSLSFLGSMDKDTEGRKKGLSSPDLSHLRTVFEGDTLPLMCERIYGDSSMYLKVAQVNKLVNFRYLEPGTEILFPPIR
jgi:hypothetical protein